MTPRLLPTVAAVACLVCAGMTLSACELFGVDEKPPESERQVPVAALLSDSTEVQVDPTGRTPLAARVVLHTRNPTTVTVKILGPLPVSHAFAVPDTVHSLPVLGLYAGTDNRVVIRIQDEDVGVGLDTLLISTGPLPEGFPDIDVTVADTVRMEPGLTFSEFSLANDGTWLTQPILFDANGDVRWYLDLSSLGALVLPVKRLANGNFGVPQGANLYEINMLGEEIRHWTLSGYWQHHELFEKPDGNLLLAVDVDGRGTVGDEIVEMDRASGAIVRTWDLRQVLDVRRRAFFGNDYDWLHMNALWYDERDRSLIISGRNQGVFKVTEDNRLVWILAPHRGWGPAGVDGEGEDTAPYLLTAVDASGNPYPDDVQEGTVDADDFAWVWGQHAPLLLPNGNLFVFDNGLNRNFAENGRYSRGVEYEIDEANRTVRQVWEYGEERGPEFYSQIISDVDYLPETGNRLIMPGIVPEPGPHAQVTEVTYPEGRVVFDARLNFKNLTGSGSGWGQMDIVYRSHRMPLYPVCTTCTLVDGAGGAVLSAPVSRRARRVGQEL